MTDEVLTADAVTQECPDCGEPITGKVTGRGSLSFKMGAHRANKHGYRSGASAANKAKRGMPSQTEQDRPAVVRIAVDAAGELSGGKGPPTEAEWVRVLGKTVYSLSVGFASWAAETDPTVRNEADRDAIQDYLSLDPRDANEMVRPIARPVSGSKLNAKAGRKVADNVEAVAAVVDVGLYFARIRRYYRIRGAKLAAASAPAGVIGPTGQVWAAPDGVVSPTFGEPGSQVPPGSQTGVVVTPDMVAAMRNGHGQTPPT